MISDETLNKISEITRLHDEAFWHLHQFDGHAKSSDGSVQIHIEFGNVWERQDGPVQPRVSVAMYSYVVASDTPLYPSFGERNHYFETVDQALQVMKEWHKAAMAYQPTPEDLAEADEFAREMWETIKDKVTIVDVTNEPFTLPERFRDKSNGE
jgi:hypothetical protein